MSRGVTINDPVAILPAGTKLRLLRDRILLEPLDWSPSRIISVVRHGRPLRGIVRAVGPGRFHRVYEHARAGQQTRKFRETARYVPTELKVGDVVELGGLNVYDGRGYNFPQVMIGTAMFIICQEQDVCFVNEQEAA